MRNNLVIGILKETKRGERRSPLIPNDVKWLKKRGIEIEVESSKMRAFKDIQFKRSGVKIVKKFQNADLLIGIKEPKIKDLYPNKVYMLFSHTCKGQPHNMPLLKACLDKNITLLDFEKIEDSNEKRLIYFGEFAGICGMIDSLYYLGKKLKHKGIKNPFCLIKPSFKYNRLKEIKSDFINVRNYIKKKGLHDKLSPFIIGITGHGNVSKGVQEVLGYLNPVEIHPKDMTRFVQTKKTVHNRIYKIVFLREEKMRSKKGGGFYFEQYCKNPNKFESNLDVYLPYLNMLIHTSYWDPRYPKLVTKKMVDELYKKKSLRLEFIGDISCDVCGSIELTRKATTSENPVFTYNPQSCSFKDGYKYPGITILAVDNLPSELPKDASKRFSHSIREYVYQIAAHGVKDLTNHVAIPIELRNAVITQAGKLTKKFTYLSKNLKI